MIIEKSIGIFGRVIWIVSYKGVECFNYNLDNAIEHAYKSTIE
jgi:hypothetical protein